MKETYLFVLKALYALAVEIFGINHGTYFGVNNVMTLWLITIILSILLYPLMLKFSEFKHNNKQIKFLKYL